MISYFINYGVSLHVSGVNLWRIPFGFQLVPAGIMLFGLLTVKVCDFSFNSSRLQLILFFNRGISSLARLRRPQQGSYHQPCIPP